MVSIRRRRPSGPVPDGQGHPQTYRTLPRPGEPTAASAVGLLINGEIVPKLEGMVRFSYPTPAPQPLFQEKELKKRKRQRRKQQENQEPCVMRGVYFKNMKWQAAIKVDKKQVHLGTVGSQEEAARLYDRAAYMCGREPNFELSEEEKRELQGFKWEEFLEITRKSILNKKRQRVKPELGTETPENEVVGSTSA